jgi:hypothetical protein
MLKITSGKGFHITFNNGYRISVQFGAGNYCDNHFREIDYKDYENQQRELGEKGSTTCEIAIFDPNDVLIEPEGWDDQVRGWVAPNELVEWMEYTSKL